MSKKILSLITALVIMLSLLSGCGGLNSDNPSTSEIVVYTPVIPTQTKYPTDMSNYDVYINEYDSWLEGKNERLNQPDGYQNSYVYFLKNSFRVLMKEAGAENKVCSPVNIYLALAMLSEITDGNSRKEILDALGCDNIAQLRSQAKSVWLSSNCNDGYVTNNLASSVWLSNTREYKRDSIESIVSNYYSSVYSGDVTSNAYTEELQKWVNDHTGNLLQDSVKGIKLDKNTVLALITSVYYESAWEEPFESFNTDSNVFEGVNGGENADFMNAVEYLANCSTAEYEFVYKKLNSGNKMVFINPINDNTVDSVIRSESFADMLVSGFESDNIEYRRIHLSVPKFDVKADMDLIPVLSELGIGDVLDARKADFTPLTNDVGLSVDEAKHAARVMIDEQGCVAAAYTEIMVKDTAIEMDKPYEFVLDKPFIFAIIGDNNLPLFVGSVDSIY